jgi:hypothetical protein
MLHKVSGSYSLKSLFLTPQKNLASKQNKSYITGVSYGARTAETSEKCEFQILLGCKKEGFEGI